MDKPEIQEGQKEKDKEGKLATKTRHNFSNGINIAIAITY